MTSPVEKTPHMRSGSRAVAVAALLVLGPAGCSADAPAQSEASPTLQAVESSPQDIDAEPSPEGMDAEPSPEGMDAEQLLVELPDGLTYVEAADLEQQMRDGMDRSGASHIIDSLAARGVESGSVPVGAVVAFVLNDKATSAEKQGILRGMEEGAGTEGQPVDVDGTPATYIEMGDGAMLLHVGEDVVFMVFGQSRADIDPLLAALVNGTPSKP